jgi:3,5-epimerase/4-reductase
MKWLIYGANGWIGGQACELLSNQGETIVKGEARVDDKKAVTEELLRVKPDRVMSFIGRTSGPGYNTIDYLEQKGKLIENLRDNLYGPIVLAFLCTKYDVHFTYLGTGCIFYGYDAYDEEAEPNFFGSEYSAVKGKTDQLMHFFEDSVLNARIRMPIVAEDHPRNFITKIRSYKKVCSMPNSMTILPELLPILLDMAKNKVTGTINLTNPGLITHNEILDIVKELVDPNLTYENFSVEEQRQILLAGRSNNELDSQKLMTMYPNVLPVKEALRKILEKKN